MYIADNKRYECIKYNHCGDSGLKLPVLSLGLWQNFGKDADYDEMKDIILTAFDNGITHFDLANNYGPEPGRAEINFGRIFNKNLKPYRDEIIISTKAGYEMWDGPYGGRGGTRKYLTASLDQSLNRMGLEYVDIFYHHCMTPETPLNETALCLSDIIRQGKALYCGISNYDGDTMNSMNSLFEKYNVPYIINQNRYSIFDRTVENNGLLKASHNAGKGIIAFSPLAQGLLSDKYANRIPEGARAFENKALIEKLGIDENKLKQVAALSKIAKTRQQSLSQMAIDWLLSKKEITSVLVGIRTKQQLLENLEAVKHFEPISNDENRLINEITDRK